MNIVYLFVMGIVWAIVGVLTNAHKGAMVASIIGFAFMLYLSLLFIVGREDDDPANPIARAFGNIVFWGSIPLALLLWGNETFAHGSDAFKFLGWVAGSVITFRLLCWLRYKAEQKWGTN